MPAKADKPGAASARGRRKGSSPATGAPVPAVGARDRMPEGLTLAEALAWREQRRQSRRVLLGLAVDESGAVKLAPRAG